MPGTSGGERVSCRPNILCLHCSQALMAIDLDGSFGMQVQIIAPLMFSVWCTLLLEATSSD